MTNVVFWSISSFRGIWCLSESSWDQVVPHFASSHPRGSVRYLIIDISGGGSCDLLISQFSDLMEALYEDIGRVLLLYRRDPLLEQLDDHQVVFLKELQVSISANTLVCELQMLHFDACLPKELHSKFIVGSMRARFACL